MPKLASQYPCHCHERTESCACVPGRTPTMSRASPSNATDLCVNGRHLEGRSFATAKASKPPQGQRYALLHDQLQIAAEYWHRTENFETHWATQWSSEDVSRFISLITGSYPDALQLNGKQLLRLAIATHARRARVDNEDIANEFYELVISTIHRKRIVRLFLQNSPPENMNAVKARGDATSKGANIDQGRSHAPTPRGFAAALPSARLSAASEERDRIEALQSHGDRPVLTVSGQTQRAGGACRRLEVKLSVASFLLEQLKTPEGEPPAVPQALAKKTHHGLHAGVDLEVCIHFQEGSWRVNPQRHSICWLRQQHDLSFDLEGESEIKLENASRSASPPGSCAQGHVEVWAGPILLARVLIQLPIDATTQGAPSTSSFAHSEYVLLAEAAFHQRIALVCGSRELAFRNAIARIETSLRGCTSVTHVIKDEVDLHALWGTDEERLNGLVQVSLTRASLSSKAVLQAVETLLRLIEAADGTDEITPSIVVHTWTHPRPDVETNPIMARLLGQIGMAAYSFHRVDSLVDTSPPSSSALLRDATDNQEHGFYSHAPANLQRLAPGTPVDFQVPGSSSESKWKQGKIVSVTPHDGTFNIAPNNGGKVVHGVLKHQVRISSFGKAPSASHRHHPGSQSRRLAKRSRKRRDIFASLCVGDRIFARPHSGLGQGDYQPGVIVALHKSSFTADVAFDSGRAVAHMDIRDVRPHPSQQHAAQDHRRQESPRASGEPESKLGHMHTRASTGAMPHGTPVQIIKSTESAAVGIIGRVRRALEFGLRYDVMLSNGDTMHNVPVGLLRRLDADRDASSDASQNSKVIGSHSYVDAICDRYKQVLRDAAQSRPDGKELRIQFDRLDRNRTAQLEASDFLGALHDLGFKPSESEVLEFIDRMSERRDGFVTYEDFVRFALPHGVQIGQRQLKRPLAFYKASLESSGVLRILESALETRLGELWERLADLDSMSLGILQEDVFTRCLTRLGARASADQYSALTRTFADSDGKVDYREFAVVVEVLLVQKITNASVQLTTQVQSTRRSSAHDERMDKDGRLLGPMERKLRKEIDAATRIQALARRRIAQRSIAIQKRQQLRAAQVSEVWTGSGCEGSHIERQGPQRASSKIFERHAQVIDQWRRLMLLNTRNGAEVMTTFRAMDRDCDGLVSLEELSATLCKYSIDARCAGMLLREMDLDNDGAVDLTDFKMFLAGVQQRIVARDTALASTQPAIHVMIDELGQDLCAKLRRYFAVLKRCGTDLLELLLYRPRGLTMTSILRKQGFVLERPEWKRLEVHFASMADHRGDRSVCEDFVRLLGMSLEEFDEQQFSKHEHHLREYLQNTKTDSDVISGLGRLSHKVVSAIKDLCKDDSLAESKHEALWWLLSLREPGEPLTLDRVDLERFFRALKLRPTSFEMDHLLGAQSAEPNGSTMQCTKLAKLFGISPRIYEYLEEDHMYSRFCRSYVMTQRARLRVEAVEAITFVRREGSAAFVRWLRDAIGVSAYRKFRAMVIAAVSRGVRVTSGAWLSERTSAKLGFSSSTQLERVLIELNFGLNQDEIRNLCRALVQAASGDVDLFAFADLCEAIYSTAALGESGGSGNAGAMGDADDEALEKAREETERYLREVIQEYIRTPTGHRNLVQVFESFDTQRNGTLDQSELEAVFKSLGVDLVKVDTGSLLRHYDVNQDGQLSYHEFLEAIDVRVHPVAEEMPKKVRYGYGKTVTKATQIDLDLLRDKLEKYNLRVKLCREDVDDACARVTSRGLLSRRDVTDILAALGLGHCLTDSEVYSFSRLTRRKFKAFLLDVVKGRFSLAPRDNARTLGTVSTAAGEKESTSSPNATITADTKVVLKMAPHTGKMGTVVGPGRSAGTYEICLEGNGQVGKILDNVRRSQIRVAGGRPMICENTVVIDKATQQRGIVIRFALSDPDHVDVRFQNIIRKHVASSTLEALPADVSVASLSRGRRVFARSEVDDQYFAGSILRVDGRNGSADVQFDHGEREMGVTLKHIKPISSKTSA